MSRVLLHERPDQPGRIFPPSLGLQRPPGEDQGGEALFLLTPVLVQLKGLQSPPQVRRLLPQLHDVNSVNLSVP